MVRLYEYVGPDSIAARVPSSPKGNPIESLKDALQWVRSHTVDKQAIATYVIDEAGTLLLADRSSEHAFCAGGRCVQAAGEMIFAPEGDILIVVSVTNQSTGYCPEPDSWFAVQSALERIGIPGPQGFEEAYVFRRCESCGSTNIVKNEIFRCSVCDGELPTRWNFGRGKRHA